MALVAPPTLDLEPQAYIAGVSKNIENDKRRFRRQYFKFRAQEDEALVDDSGQPLPCPEEDAAIPRVPVGLGRHKPCLWVPPPRMGAPKREREEPAVENSSLSGKPKLPFTNLFFKSK